MNDGNQGHAAQKKNKDKPGIVVVIDGPQQHGNKNAQKQNSVLGGTNRKLLPV